MTVTAGADGTTAEVAGIAPLLDETTATEEAGAGTEGTASDDSGARTEDTAATEDGATTEVAGAADEAGIAAPELDGTGTAGTDDTMAVVVEGKADAAALVLTTGYVVVVTRAGQELTVSAQLKTVTSSVLNSVTSTGVKEATTDDAGAAVVIGTWGCPSVYSAIAIKLSVRESYRIDRYEG